ncbi:MAG: DUF4136 domain-containing protein [Longimicrobiales bacterium]
MIRTPLLARAVLSLRTLSVCTVLTGALVSSGCYSVKVRTLGAPNSNLERFRTFKIMDAPIHMNGSHGTNGTNGTNGYNGGSAVLPAWSAKPMLNNQITFDAGREYLRQALLARGFVEDKKNPDFTVAFYASARERLNITDWGYGYDCCYGYGYGSGPYITEYTEGTVLVDLVDPDTKKLVWRGSGVATVSDNPRKYLKELARIVPKIVDKLPVGYPAVVAVDGQ